MREARMGHYSKVTGEGYTLWGMATQSTLTGMEYREFFGRLETETNCVYYHLMAVDLDDANRAMIDLRDGVRR